MDLLEQALHFCKHIQTLTGVHCTVLDVPAGRFCLPPFRCACHLESASCDAYRTHLYGCYEAERWDGKYIYYCPRGLVFTATALRQEGCAMEYGLVTGPFLLSNSDEDLFEDPAVPPDPLESLLRFDTIRARALGEVIYAVCGYLTGTNVAPDIDSGRHAEILQMMYDLSAQPAFLSYPLDSERRLQQQIRAGDKENSQKLLNELLCHLYFVSGTDLDVIKLRVRELLTLMSRAAIDGGADVNEIFGLCYHYAKEVDSFGDIESLNIWLSAILHKFISYVFDFSEIKHQNVIRKTTFYIKEHLDEKLTLEQAAEQVYLSKSYFCRVLRDELGCTFTEYVNRLRIERSKVYLRETAMSIAEIAGAIGFDDQSYFTRIFKKHVGIPPGKYRERHFRSDPLLPPASQL